MLFRESQIGLIAVPQPSHAWLAGQIVRAWGNAAFGTVTPYEEVCLGAEQHDIGWLTWERAPTLDAVTGRPHSFRDVGVAAHTAIWAQGTELALALGRYPALLVSLHGTGLYASFDAAGARDTDAAIVRDFLGEQRAIQRGLIESLRADKRYMEFASDAQIERNRRLVRAADRLSIAICTAMRDQAVRTDNPRVGIVRQVPTAGGEADISLRMLDRDSRVTAVTPWPFAAAAVRLACEGILLPPDPFENETEMRAALRAAARVPVVAELRPG